MQKILLAVRFARRNSRRRGVLAALAISFLVAPLTFASPPLAGDRDTAAALATLQGLSPQRQAAVVDALEQACDLHEIGQTQIPLLSKLVEEASWTLNHRQQVAFVLAALGAPGADALDGLSRSEQDDVRAISINALRWRALAERMRSPDPRVREHTVREILAYVAEHPAAAQRAVAALTDAYTRDEETRAEVRVEAVRGLVRLAPRSVPALVQTLRRPDPFFFQYTRGALAAIGPSVRASLRDRLRDRDPLVRQRVIYVLAEFEIDDETADAIRRLENDADPSVRKAAARVLAAF